MACGDYPVTASPQQVATAIHAQGLWVKQDPGRAALQYLANQTRDDIRQRAARQDLGHDSEMQTALRCMMGGPPVQAQPSPVEQSERVRREWFEGAVEPGDTPLDWLGNEWPPAAKWLLAYLTLAGALWALGGVF